jgi:DNA-directed RNA polymerase subunit M/transcription elongation factor TFIIS
MIGEPYVIKCPQCGNLILTSVIFGGGCCSCKKCSPKEFIHFDFISKEELKENQTKYRDFINGNKG